jgi:branched-chain amino acid transport system substrate-binding protein
MLKRLLHAFALAMLAVAAGHDARSAEPIKVGILVTTTGPYSAWGTWYQQAVGLYLDRHNGKDGNPTVEILYRDVGGDNPPRARQLAQELIVRDEVAILGGLEFTTTVLAMADVITEAKIPFIIFNGATSFVTDKSPYYVRVAATQWLSAFIAAKWATEQNLKKTAIVAADYAPGTDLIDAFTRFYTQDGGSVVDVIKVPMGTTDFSSYLQRVKDVSPQVMYMFMPLGPMSVSLAKGFAERGYGKQGIQLLAGAEMPESDLPAIGDGAIGAVTVLHYGPYLDNPMNNAFREALIAKYGQSAVPSFATVAAYDGMEAIFHMLKASGGNRDPDKMMAAIKGYAWQSPRGPVSIDPKTREIIENVYVRRVEKVNGMLINKEFETYKDQKDPWHELNPPK